MFPRNQDPPWIIRKPNIDFSKPRKPVTRSISSILADSMPLVTSQKSLSMVVKSAHHGCHQAQWAVELYNLFGIERDVNIRPGLYWLLRATKGFILTFCHSMNQELADEVTQTNPFHAADFGLDE